MIEKCLEVNEPSKFFTQFETYLKLHNERSQHLQDYKDVQIHQTTGEHKITFQSIARLNWQISYDPDNDSFRSTYKVGLSNEGQKLVQTYNFPEEILTKGYTNDWTVQECMKNLQQMVNLESDTDSPVKKSRK